MNAYFVRVLIYLLTHVFTQALEGIYRELKAQQERLDMIDSMKEKVCCVINYFTC